MLFNFHVNFFVYLFICATISPCYYRPISFFFLTGASLSSRGSSQADKNANISYHPDGHHPYSNGSHDMSRDRSISRDRSTSREHSTSRDQPSVSPHPDAHRAYSVGSHGSPRDRASPRGQLNKSLSESHATTSRDRPTSRSGSRDQRPSVTESIESETNV